MTNVTIVGNLTGSPELKFIPNGAAVCQFSVAVSQRVKQGGDWIDGEPMYLRVTAWRDLAEHVAESLDRGQRVIVTGKLKMRSYESKGEKRQSWEIDADEVGPSLRWAVAKVEKTTGNGPRRDAKPRNTQPEGDDPWGVAAEPTDEVPF